MGMIQIDMEMPKNCEKCSFCHEDYGTCVAAYPNFNCWQTGDGERFDACKNRNPQCPLKNQEEFKPRILYTVERHCGYCDKILEDGWLTCPWCGSPVSFKVGEAK